MKLIRYILSHALLLAFLVILGIAYYFRVQLFPPNMTAHIDNTVHQVMVMVRLAPKAVESEQAEPVINEQAINQTDESQSKAIALAKPEISKSEISESETHDTNTKEIASSEPVAPVEVSPVDVTQQAVSLPVEDSSQVKPTVPQPQEDKAPVADAVETNENMAAVQAKEPSTVTEAEPAVELAEAAEAQQPNTASTDKEATEQSHAALIDQARLAFQTGDSSKAINLYQELGELNPDDPNIPGEMGNIFYIQGKWKEAGQAYYEAAIRLMRQGQTGQVQYLYRVIHGLDKESAEKLSSQMGR